MQSSKRMSSCFFRDCDNPSPGVSGLVTVLKSVWLELCFQVQWRFFVCPFWKSYSPSVLPVSWTQRIRLRKMLYIRDWCHSNLWHGGRFRRVMVSQHYFRMSSWLTAKSISKRALATCRKQFGNRRVRVKRLHYFSIFRMAFDDIRGFGDQI